MILALIRQFLKNNCSNVNKILLQKNSLHSILTKLNPKIYYEGNVVPKFALIFPISSWANKNLKTSNLLVIKIKFDKPKH